MKKILFNSDVGEEAGFDNKIMPYISLCNIACGAHAGNEKVIRETIDLALEFDVKIGAHPSYPDRKNFGRTSLKISSEDLMRSLTDQILLLKYWVEKAGARLYHVKPHGALYNDASVKEEVAKIIISAIKNIDKSLQIISPKKSIISYLAAKKLMVLSEVFADRNYKEDLTLVSRSEKNAVITDPEIVFEHVFRMISDGRVKTPNGVEVPIFFDTICVHGDNPKSVQILEYIYRKLTVLNFVMK